MLFLLKNFGWFCDSSFFIWSDKQQYLLIDLVHNNLKFIYMKIEVLFWMKNYVFHLSFCF